jgi:hypothetical protein
MLRMAHSGGRRAAEDDKFGGCLSAMSRYLQPGFGMVEG